MIKKAILTGGGHATRLRPLTSTINKHLIPLANKPMIFHAIEKVIKIGATEIFINTNPGETELQKVVGDGSRWGAHITFFEQTGGPQGIAHVVKQAEKFIGADPFLFYLSDNIILSDLNNLLAKFEQQKLDCLLALAQVADPERFGVPVFGPNQELLAVEEKPKHPMTNFAVTGIYFYGPKVFFEAFDHIAKSARGEYEISDIHTDFLNKKLKVGYEEITGWWKDTGKSEDLLLANKLLLDIRDLSEYIKTSAINSDTVLSGPVEIGDGSQIGEGVVLTGPVIIGEDCKLQHCHVGPYVTLGKRGIIKDAIVTSSIIFSDCEIVGQGEVIECLVGNNSIIQMTDGRGLNQQVLGAHSKI